MAVKRTRLGGREMLVPVLVWSATFATFVFVGISLAVTTNPIYSLLILVGFLMSTLVTDFYRSDRRRSAPSAPHGPLCHPRLETHSPVSVEVKSTFYPQASATMPSCSEPCLCKMPCTPPPQRSFSSPKVHRASGTMGNASSVSFVQRCPPHGAVRGEPRCEEVKSCSYHKPYTCYGVRTVGILYEDDAVVDDGVVDDNVLMKGNAAEERSEDQNAAETVIDMSGTEPPDIAPASRQREKVRADAESTSKETPLPHRSDSVVGIKASEESRKPKRRLLWNMFAPEEDKRVLKEVKSEASSSSGPSIEEPALASPKSIASAPEYRKVVATIQRNIDEGRGPKVVSKADRSLASECSSTAKRRSMSPGVNSAKRSSSSGVTFPFRKDSPRIGAPRPSPTKRSLSPSRPISPSSMQGSEHQYQERQPLRQEVFDGRREEQDRARPMPSMQSASREHTAREVESLRDVSNGAGPSMSQKVNQAPTGTSGVEKNNTFQLPSWIQADLVEVTVINNPQQLPDSNPSLLKGPSAKGPAPLRQSKHVQASCKTSNAAVQMDDADSDGKRGAKPKSKWKLRLIPRFLKGKSKRYKH